jgi:hypothetical protein
LDYLGDLIEVRDVKNTPVSSDGFVYCTELSYKITPLGLKNGFTHGDILFNQWLTYIKVSVFLIRYKKVTFYVSSILALINIASWSFIISSFSDDTFAMWPFVVRRFGTTVPKLGPRHLRHVAENHQNDLKNATGGRHSPGHPVYGDFNKHGIYEAEGSVTHGNPPDVNSTELGTQKGNTKPTRAIPFENPVPIQREKLKGEIPGSKDFLNEPTIKEKLDDLKKDS